MHQTDFARPVLAFVLACALAAAGCGGGSSQITGPNGEAGGINLVVYASDRNQTSGAYDLYLYDLDQVGFRSLAGANSTDPETEPSITRDGQYVAFASTRATGLGSSDIYLFDRLTAGLVATPGLNSGNAERSPRFTYDAQKLAFERDSAGVHRIRLYEPVGDTLIKLPGLDAPGAGNDDAPSPNGNGTRIAFESDRAGAKHVYVWDRATGLMSVPAAVGDTADVEPSLSSNGQYLCFASNRSGGTGGWDVYLYDLTAMAFIPLPNLNSTGNDRHPTINSDASVIAFQSDRSTGAGKNDVLLYVRSSGTILTPASLSGAGDDVQPYLK